MEVRPSREERREYRAAKNRIKESILLRDVLPGHTYPRREEDLATLKRYHSKYGVPGVGLMARARRLLEGRGL